MHTTPDTAVLKRAVQVACRAPSVHNSQPWRWVAEHGALRLFAEPHRVLPATDHSGREMLLSCGAVLHHLCVAMMTAGWDPHITRFPDPKNSTHLATVEFRPLDLVTDTWLRRAEAILQRRSDRLPLGRPTYWDLFEPGLRAAVDEILVTLDVLGDEARPHLVKATELTGALRRNDASYLAELCWWTSPFALAEGVPPSALVSDTEHRRVDVGREFPFRGHQDRRPEVKVDWAKILVLSTPDDTRADVLRCGEVLSAVLLECTMAGMATCTLTHLIELEESRDIVRQLVPGRGDPQVLVRTGIAPPMERLPAATPRRPVDDVLEIR